MIAPPILARQLHAPKSTRWFVGWRVALITVFIVLSAGFFTLRATHQDDSGQILPVRIVYQPHDPIFIYGDVGFEGDNSTTGVTWGSGTESDPYIIEGWKITSVGDIGILVEDTTAHFVIRNCMASNMGPIGEGIHLSNCANCTVANNELTGSASGIFAAGLANSTIVGNNCSDNLWQGIAMFGSRNNTLIGNLCNDSGEGIALYSSSDWNTIISNEVCHSTGYAVRIDSGSHNSILNNTFVGNNGAASVFDSGHVQASDNGTLNAWDKGPGAGNYWSDWTVPDDDMNGVVDNPYAIGGSASAVDHYPRTTVPLPIPEFGSIVFIGSSLVALFVVLLRSRR